MGRSLRAKLLSRNFYCMLGCALVLLTATAATVYAQCPTIDNRGWGQGATVRFFLNANLTEEQKRQIRLAIGEWNYANSVNNSRVIFVEDTSGQNFSFHFLNGTLPPGTPAFANKTFNVSGTVVSATLTYDPNAVFPGTNMLIIDPNKAGYDTIFIKLTLHEMGHTMGLDHPTQAFANICDQPNGATVMNYVCNENDLGGNLPVNVAACDQNSINTESIYPTPALSPPSVQFQLSAYSASEGAGSIAVTVTRTGSTAASAIVNFSTSDNAGLNNCNVFNGVASSRCDYATSVVTLRFAAGETSKTISIPIVDDVYVEGNESFTLSLTNPRGALLGAVSSAIATLTDNGNEGGANPIDQTAFFVRQHYIDFLNREPDPQGFTDWQAILNNCPVGSIQCDRIQVSADFFRSPEFRERGYFPFRFYLVSLGRKPSYSEFMPDLARVSGFLTEAEKEQARLDFIAEFMSRTEFTNIYNSLSNNAYVQRLFDTSGVTQVTVNGGVQTVQSMQQAMASGKSRAQVLREIVESPEVDAKFYTQAFVVMQYFGYLRRDPDALYQQLIDEMNANPQNYRQMVHIFVNSQEYRARFGP
jgi:Calx-beta domain/Domain of unknown function (DUF4214)